MKREAGGGRRNNPPSFRRRPESRICRIRRPESSAGVTGGKCPGYVVDHIVPLCAGGADDPANMQWQARAESYAKDRAELALCRWIRRAKAMTQWMVKALILASIVFLVIMGVGEIIATPPASRLPPPWGQQ